MSCDYIALANAGIQNLKPYQAGKPIEELQRELGLKEIIKLASNENPLGTSYRVQDACSQALEKLALYPDSNAFELKRSLSHFYDVEAKNIILGNGSNDILDLLAQVFLNDKSSAVFSQYAFVVYPIATQIAGAKSIVVPAIDWGHDLEAMLDAIQKDTKIVFIANPNNPTGTYLSHQAIEQFLSQVPENVIVILDEAYYEYCHELEDYPRAFELQKTYSNLVISRTFSKAYGLAGLRIGYAIAHPDIIDVLNRARAPFNVNSLALAAAKTALTDKKFLAESIEVNALGLKQLSRGFEDLGVEYIESVANFICIKVGDAATIYQQLLELGVIVRPLAVYGMPEYLRVSVGLEEENEFFLKQLKTVLNK